MGSEAGTTKAPRVKVPAKHPPYFEMVEAAIAGVGGRNGASRHAISKFVCDNYQVDPVKSAVHLKLCLKNSLAKGKLKMARESGKGAGGFKIVKEEKPKKVVKPKATSVVQKSLKTASAKRPAKSPAAKKTVKKTTAKSPGKKVAKKTAKSPAKKASGKVAKSPAAKKAAKPVKKAVPAKSPKPKSTKPAAAKKAALKKAAKKGYVGLFDREHCFLN